MALRPTQKMKKRYILFSLKGNLGKEELEKGIYKHSLRFFGEHGLSTHIARLIEFDEKRKEGILLANREGANSILGMLALINEIEGRPARLIAKRTSGTLLSLREKEKG
ncbi:MAG: Rpp14/Pop5 family protein [Candidatus Bilamarchaeaceae archaeon]